MNRSNDYGRRGTPDQRYGGYEEGYGHVPGGEREWRRRDLSAGRYGSMRERHPYEADALSWRDDRPDDRRDRPDRPERRQGAVYYPGRTEADYREQESPHVPGYVSAYSSGYEDGYQAGTRSSREVARDYGAQPGTQPRRLGPKNYVRSDDRVREEVCERLAHRDQLDVSDVTVTVQSGVVTLEGSVNDRRMKYEVEDVADDTFGVTDVVNRLHVRPYGVLASE